MKQIINDNDCPCHCFVDSFLVTKFNPSLYLTADNQNLYTFWGPKGSDTVEESV